MAVKTPQDVWMRLHRTKMAHASKRIVRRTYTGWVERHLNIQTTWNRRHAAPGHFGDATYYEACDYPFIGICLNALELGPDDVIYEIGCGMGRALCMMARRPVKKSVGVELCEDLAEKARANVQSMRGRKSAVEVLTADAAFVDYSEATAFYLFNPFGATTMRVVLDRIRQSLADHPRRLRFVYLNPFQDDVFEGTGWLRKTRTVRSKWFRTYASLWVHEPTESAPVL